MLQVVADELVILLAVARAYRNKPVDIVTASGIDQALAQLDVFDFDLFVIDLDIKEGDSFSLLETITESTPQAPVILMTTADTKVAELIETIASIRCHRCWHLLEKPFDYKKLSGFIARGLHERYPNSDQCCAVHPVRQEKRHCQRFSRFEHINLFLSSDDKTAGRRPQPATLVDISLGGIGVTTMGQILEGTRITFNEKFMHQTGLIVWSRINENQNWQAGIKFV